MAHWTQVICAAVESGWLAGVQILVQHGADVNAVTATGLPILFVASRDGHLGLVQFLVDECGATVDTTDTVRIKRYTAELACFTSRMRSKGVRHSVLLADVVVWTLWRFSCHEVPALKPPRYDA